MDARFAEADAKQTARFAEADARELARFAEADTKQMGRFAEADARELARLAALQEKIDARFALAEAKADARFAEMGAKLDRKFADLIKWMVMAAIATGAVGATFLGIFLSNLAPKLTQADGGVMHTLALTSPVQAAPAIPRARSGYWSEQTARRRSASLPS
jgi:hypothetical protein